jgi:subtilisin family serine protease
MHRKTKVGCVLAAAAMIAGVTPAATAAAAPATPPEVTGTAGKALKAGQPFRSVTLVTGDRLMVATDGSNRVAVRAAKGRERIRFVSETVRGHLRVTPADALPLVNTGRLDSRLFDVTALLEYGYDDRRADLPLIVTYAPGGKAAVRANATTAGATIAAELPAANGLALKQSRSQAAAFWQGLTAGRSAGGVRALRGEVGRVWLDAMRTPTLDVSVPQIGAPAAWQQGLAGDGVTVAVVDTGIDATHPDLAGKVVAAKNFTIDGDALDRVGHGTHVASTIAGTGAASGGRYKGVAPNAKLYDAKVCMLQGCQESWIIGGMQWAAAEQHARVVNMSLGGQDTPEVDPVEQAVQTLTAQYGTLFVIAAGNDGADASVGSPASADDALAVGAVTKADELAGFSSRGPRVGDSALKPEITGPGVEIIAARGKDSQIGVPTGPDGRYMALSGTSMATPHVAGAAAILAQAHADWKPAQLKAALMAAAKPNPAVGVYAQGAGRVDVARAVRQTVTTSPAGVSFGLQQWPHADDTPQARTVTYHNAGSAPVTLRLALDTKGGDGKPAPAGMFSVSAPTVTVPAGGDASVTVGVDTRVAGPDGYAGGALTATAGDVVVQTPVAVEREVESYDLTVVHLDRNGKPATAYGTTLVNLDKPDFRGLFDPSGTVRQRVPKGRYLISSMVFDNDPQVRGATSLVQPVFAVDRPQTVTFDARIGKPVSVSVPRTGATQVLASVEFTMTFPNGGYGSAFIGDTFDGVYTAQVGPKGKIDGFSSSVTGQWGQVQPDGRLLNSPYAYLLSWFEQGRMMDGFQRKVAERELARVHAEMGVEAAAPGLQATKLGFARLAGDQGGGGWASGFTYDLPNSRTEYYNTDRNVEHRSSFMQEVPSADPQFPFPMPISGNDSAWTQYRAGRSYHEVWNRAVFGPAFPAPDWPLLWATRTGDSMLIAPPMYGDHAGRAGFSNTDTAGIAVYRDGVKVIEEPYLGSEFAAPAAAGRYRVTVTGTRSAPFTLSTGNTATWTFRSGHVDGTQPQSLPLSAIRFMPKLDQQNKAPADCLFTIPIQVQRQPGSAAGNTRTLIAEVSFDDGKNWQKAQVVRHGDGGTAVLRHPKGSGFVSLKAAASDSQGNTVEQTILRAYRY